MKKVLLIAVIALTILPQISNAQRSYTSVLYSMGFGMGDLGDYISQTSFRGVMVEYRNTVSPGMYAGIDVAWNVFYERKDYATYSEGTKSLSGIQYRYSNQLPILLSVEKHLNPDSPTRPYVGLGLGTMYSRRVTEMGVYVITEDTWHFALKPEIGIIREISSTKGMKIGLKYLTGFGAGDLDTQSYLGLTVGFIFL